MGYLKGAFSEGKSNSTPDPDVTVVLDEETGVVTFEAWYNKDGRPHRDGGPAVIERDPASRVVTFEARFRDGQLHSDDAPAVIKRDPESGIVTFEAWRKDGRLHRDSGPAIIKRDPASGVVLFEDWQSQTPRKPSRPATAMPLPERRQRLIDPQTYFLDRS